MDIFGAVFSLAGVVIGLFAWMRVENLEKKLKRFDVIPNDFDSLDNPK